MTTATCKSHSTPTTTTLQQPPVHAGNKFGTTVLSLGSMSQQAQHYAFVASSEPLVVPQLKEEETNNNNQQAPPPPPPTSSPSRHPQESIVALYQSYAERFPNPNLIQEYQDRDQLLQATSAAHSAAHHANNTHQQQQQKKKKKGFFGRLFGGGNDEENPSTFLRQAAANHPDDDDDCLVYTDPPAGITDNNNNNLSLCGTHHHSLDRSCIPQDAHSMARLSLASQRTRQERPLVVRSSPHLQQSSTLCIVGLGMMAEWNPRNHDDEEEGENNMQMDSNCSITSDRLDLLRFAENKRDFDLSLVRAVSFGPNFLLVSWGFNDGVVVFYRRIALANNNNSSLAIAWESVVFLGPSSAVLEHSLDVFADDDDDDSGSDLLRITDMVPLVVTTPGMPAAALAVSRLGGYMEVLPLPPNLWLGPVLDATRHKPRSTKRKRGRHHYAKEHLVNIASDRAPIPILALTTMEYHLDILCLEAIRTRVTMNTVWDREHYGNAPPPAEYILVASGTQKGHEVLTFWAITYMFAEEPPTDGSAGFTLHAVLQEALDVGSMGADLSIFANRAIMDQWRQPRIVSLKEQPKAKFPPPVDEDGNPLLEDETGEDNTMDSLLGDDHASVPTTVYDRVTTITTSAPIVSMQAIVVPISTEMGDTDFASMLSLLDWNGSVTVMDCSRLERMISHSLTEEEYAEIHDADMAGDQRGEPPAPPPPIVLVKTLIERSQMMRWMKRGSTTGNMRSCVSVQWLTRADNPADPWLVLLNTSSSSRKRHNQITILSGLLELNEVHHDAVIQCMPFPISQASLQGSVSALVVHDGAPTPSNLLRIIFPLKRRANRLCVCLLQPLQPRDIMLSLAREHKYEKAIQAARQLSQEDQQQSKVLEECRQKLWEQSFDLHWLKQVSDSAYIIQQAFLLLENNNEKGEDEGEEHKFEKGRMESGNKTDNIDLDMCREIYMLALQRASKIRLSSALTLGQDGEDLKDKLEGIIVRLGTFQLICQALNADPSFAKFRNLFMLVSIVDLARSFASAGDVAALSILCFRHRRELHEDQLELLGHLPMTLKIRHFCCLLPVLSSGQQQGSDRANSFIADISPCEGKILRHISQLPVFLKQEMDIQVVLNTDDEKMVLGRNSAICKSDNSLPLIELQDDDVGAFFSSRATDMQRFVGDLEEVADFCTVALVALGVSIDTLDVRLISGHSASHSLFCTRGCALALKRMLEESIGDSPLEVAESGLIDLSPFASVTPLDLASMELVEVVKMVLGGQDDAETIFEIYRQHLAPLLEFLPHHEVSHLDQAIHDFCVELVRSEIKFGSSDEVDVDAVILNEGESTIANMRVDDTPVMALRTCAAIATGSRTSIAKSDRIIGDKQTLISLVLTTVNDVSKRCQNRRFSKYVSLEVVKLLWDMYESLPVPTSGEGTNTLIYSDLMSEADLLYRDLVGLEILSQWPGVHFFAFISKRIIYRGESLDTDSCQRLNDVGQEALVSICRSFCSQARKQRGSVGLSILLRDLVSDVKQFFEVCYKKDSAFLPVLVNTLSSELIAPLSRQAEFDLVAQFLTGVDKSWWDHDQEGRIIGSYVDSIVFADGSNENSAGDHSLQAAIACQDALGPLFPSLQDGFQLSRRYLDAAHFINTVIFAELNMPKQIKPNDLRGDLPLDVVESILKALPTAIIIGKKEWGKESLAVQANNALRSCHEGPVTSSEHSPSKNLPPIPGGAVFHLAGILGLEDTAPVLVVKSRVVHYGVISGLFGASAAVCRTILYDRNAFSSDADAVTRMAAVAEVVSQEEYEDLATKRELCEVAMRKFQTMTSIHDCKPLDAILSAFLALEARTSLAQQKECAQILNIPPPPDSMAALHKDTWSQYSVNIHGLLTTLQQHSTGFVVDDSLLNALCRYVFFSTILRVTRPRHELAGTLEMATVNELLVLGLGLLLHIQDNAGFSLPAVKELRQILESQTLAIIKQNPSAFDEPFTKPNEEIVRQLIGRGFNQMSARRSALTTKNVGVQQALQWGVANARNPIMNEPIIFVTGNQERVDKPAVEQVMNTFKVAQQFLSGAKTVQEWRSQHPFDSPGSALSTRQASSRVESIRTVAPAPAPVPQAAKSLTTAAPALAVTRVVVPPPKAPEQPSAAPLKAAPKAKLYTSTKPPRLATVSTVKPPEPLTAKLPQLPAQAQISPTPPASVAAPRAPIPSKPLAPPNPSQPTLKSNQQPAAAPPTAIARIGGAQPPLSVKKVQVATKGGAQAAKPPFKQHTASTKTALASSKTRLAAPSNRPSSLQTGSETRSDRSALKQRSETTLGALRSAPQNQEKSMDDRRRLIEAGRRLLAKSRAENPAPPRKPPPKTSPPKATYTPYQPIRTNPTGAASKLIKPLGVVPATQGLSMKRDSPIAATGAKSKPVTSAAPPPAKQSYFFGKQMTQTNAVAAGNTINTAPATVGAKTLPLPVKQESNPISKPSARLATPGSLRPATSGTPAKASAGISAASQVPPHPPPPPPPPATSRDQGGWGDDLDDLGDGSANDQNGWGDDLDDLGDLGGESAPAPPPNPPVASRDQGGWADDLDDLGDLGDGSTGDGWDFDESANQGELPSEPTQSAAVNTATTEPTAETDPGLEDGWDDFDDF